MVVLHLYRIAQEAMTNAIKHGQTQRITMHLRSQADRFILTIQDDGVGLPATQEAVEGMGIHLMRYRASMIGAVLTLQQRPQGGTEVICSVPLPTAGETR
jgi:two-component system sensor kinase FixL